MKVAIYALTDASGKIRYVGQSAYPIERCSFHRAGNRNPKIGEILKTCTARILGWVKDTHASRWERHLIESCRKKGEADINSHLPKKTIARGLKRYSKSTAWKLYRSKEFAWLPK